MVADAHQLAIDGIVSIPFKRESASQLSQKIMEVQMDLEKFPFPSNGSAHLNPTDHEGVNEIRKFPFPSNGRAHLNGMRLGRQNGIGQRSGVSIPFKRESASQLKDRIGLDGVFKKVRFPFPSNGRAHLNQLPPWVEKVREIMFPFPSNGRARLNSRLLSGDDPQDISFHSLQTGERVSTIRLYLKMEDIMVSIPFKRESASQRNHPNQTRSRRS